MSETQGQYVIVRSANAGVFAGTLANGGRIGDGTDHATVTLTGARRLWYWDGAASLSQLAVDGTFKPAKCRFPAEVPDAEILGVCELLAVTDKARDSIAAVPVWQA